MARNLLLCLFLLLGDGGVWAVPAFPGAEGYGAVSVGGRGGAVYEVTTLNPTGSGSLDAALRASESRTVVFRVAGTIEGNFRIDNDNITIAGQTAPGDGICIKGSLGVNANDVIIRYIRVRTTGTGDAIGGRYHKNIILDHVSASWSDDEVMSFYHNENVTIQWCMITEACARPDGTHRFGGIWGNNHGTYHHNLIAHNDSRNPRWASGCKYNDYRNNVLYNWGYQSSYGGEAQQRGNEEWDFSTINMIANYYKPGPATQSGVQGRIAEPSARGSDDKGSWYVADNYIDGHPELTADNWLGVDGDDYIKLDKPWDAIPINQQTPAEAYNAVLADAGCSKPNRDSIDERIIKEVRSGTATYGNNGIISSPSDAGGWPALAGGTPPVDSDHDGMTDDWETTHNLNPSNADDRNDYTLSTDYTNLEVYLDSLISSDGTKLFKADPMIKTRPRVIVTSDGEIDDECSMVRFLLYANEWDLEGIITSSSQYHWQGHNWAGDDWVDPYFEAYAKVYPNLVLHDSRYPSPEYLKKITFLGNVKAEGEMEEITAGSQHIVKVLLDESDDRPIWLQAWGGTNTIARALKTIEEKHPEKMEYVAGKLRFFFIWEQDSTYQNYIRPSWGKYNIPTIISDQFIAIFYHWKKYLPADKQVYLAGSWMKLNILEDHGPLCSLYKAHSEAEEGFNEGDFRSEGDSPSFLHTIPNGLRSTTSPDWGGWGGRYVKVRQNTWLDSVLEPGYEYPESRWYGNSAWGRMRLRKEIPNDTALIAYLEPLWRWIDAIQNDFAARADWCVKPYDQANHPPVVKLAHANDLLAKPDATIKLSAKRTSDPDGDGLHYQWWQYRDAGTYDGAVEIQDAENQDASFTVPKDARQGDTIHIICEVTDTGTPPLTRYQRVVVKLID